MYCNLYIKRARVYKLLDICVFLILANEVITPEVYLLKQFALTVFVIVIILCGNCGNVLVPLFAGSLW